MIEEKNTNLNKSEEINTEASPSANEKDTNEKDKNTYTLKKPFEYEGKIYTEFKFDFEKMNGNMMISVENELKDRGVFTFAPESDTNVIIALAARVAGVGDDVITALPITDFLAIKRMTQRFLNNRD